MFDISLRFITSREPWVGFFWVDDWGNYTLCFWRVRPCSDVILTSILSNLITWWQLSGGPNVLSASRRTLQIWPDRRNSSYPRRPSSADVLQPSAASDDGRRHNMMSVIFNLIKWRLMTARMSGQQTTDQIWTRHHNCTESTEMN